MKEQTEVKSTFTIKISKKFIGQFAIAFVISFLIIFLLQHCKHVSCGIIWPEGSNDFGGSTFSYNPDATGGFTNEFDTYFGNKVRSDYGSSSYSMSECFSYPHKAFIYLKGTIADWIALLLLTFVVTFVIILFKRIKIKIVK